MNIFFSYPHDDNSKFVKRLKKDLEKRGHTVWFDEEKIKTGDDWRSKITRGILDSEAVVAFLSKHAVRDPGVCLNEIAIALAEKGGEAIVTVLVEPEKEVSAPVSITHVQWLKMEDHASLSADEGWYRTHFDKLVDVIENPSSANRHEELGQLKDVLNPLSFNADIASHLTHFCGRQWLIARYEEWLSKPAPGNANKVFRIEGGPGIGKTAVASFLAHATKSSVLGVHLCKSGSAITHNPGQLVLSLAYQLATRLPDYRARLLRVPCIKNPDLMKDEDAGSLWDMLISEPLAGAGKSGLIDRQRLAIVIDGLDEATKNGQNPIVDLLVDHIQTLPVWVGVVLTGRPDPELTQSLRQFTPQVINGDDPANMEDLRNYIDAWLTDEVNAKRLLTHQVPAAASALLQKSEGVFLYLAQAREEALQSNADGTKSFDLSNPGSLPSGLSALYQKSFRRRFPDMQSDPDNAATRWNALVKPLLGFVLASPEPLPLDLARQLLGWDKDATGNEKQHKALQALGSLIKRNGNPEKPETCTLAPFHNSVREWLTAESSQQFRVFTETSIYPLSEVTWKRYLNKKENDAYAWQALPDLLGKLPQDNQDELLGAPNWDTSQVLFRLAESMDPSLRFTESAFLWRMHVNYTMRLSRTNPADTKFSGNQFLGCIRLGKALATLGQMDESFLCYQKALLIAEDLNRREPDKREFVWNLSVGYERLGDTLVSLGRTEVALANYERGLKLATDLYHNEPTNVGFASDLAICLNKVGKTLASIGSSNRAMDYFQRSLDIRENIVAIEPHHVGYALYLSNSCLNIGDCLFNAERPREALAQFHRSLQIRENICERFPDSVSNAFNLSEVHDRIGDALLILGSPNKALDYFTRELIATQNLSFQAPENTDYQHDLSVKLKKIGDAQVQLGCGADALNNYQRSAAIAQSLFALSSNNVKFARLLFGNLDSLGKVLAKLGRHEEALDSFQQSLQIAEDLCELAPENIDFESDLVTSLERVGDTLVSLRRHDEALGYFRNTLKMTKKRNACEPESSKFARSVWLSFSRLGSTLASMGRTAESMECFVAYLKISVEMSANIPENVEYAHGVLFCSNQLADMLANEGHSDEALRYQRWGLGIAEEALTRTTGNAALARNVFIVSIQLGNSLAEMGLTDEALSAFQHALEILEHPAHQAQAGKASGSDLSICYGVLGATLTKLGRTEEALDYYVRNLEIAQNLSASSPEDISLSRNLFVSFCQVGGALANLNRTGEALGFYRRSLQQALALTTQAPENAQFAYDLRVSLKQTNETLVSLEQRGDELVKLERAEEAVIIYRQCVSLRESLGEELAAGNLEFKEYLSYRIKLLGAALVSLGLTEEALDCYKRSLQIVQDLNALAPENAQFTLNLCSTNTVLGDILRKLGRIDEALAYYRNSALLAETCIANEPDNNQLKNILWVSFWTVAEICEGDAALQWIRKAHAILTELEELGVLPDEGRDYLAHASIILSEA